MSWEDFGELGREAQGDANRPVFSNLLGAEWLPSIADVHERLVGDPPARVADVACGAGWSSIAIARAYPKVTVDGLDLDEASVELARGNLAGTGVEDRVSFQHRDAGDAELAGSYQLVTVFEALHDMSRPVDVLRALRSLVADDGAVIVMDERVADSFTAPGDEIERLMYTYSILCCLPVGLADSPSAGTGTVMRADTVRRYASEAGFADVEVLPIEHDFFRLYRLRARPASAQLARQARLERQGAGCAKRQIAPAMARAPAARAEHEAADGRPDDEPIVPRDRRDRHVASAQTRGREVGDEAPCTGP